MSAMKNALSRRGVVTALAVGLTVAGVLTSALAQHVHGTRDDSQASTPPAPGGVRITMEELHRAGGVPPGWRFAWPAGDPARGREAFAKLECYQCHEVQGESFPPVTPDPTRRGPALTGVGGLHPAEYFAQSVLDPNAVIVLGPGHTGPDGLSIMPDFRDSLTLAETIDLVAYIKSLTGGPGHDHGHPNTAAAAEPAQAVHEKVAGPYRVRVTYVAADTGAAARGAAPGATPAPGMRQSHAHGQQEQSGHQSGQHQHGQRVPDAAGQPRPDAATSKLVRLAVFVSDAARGEPVPYLPVTATLHGAEGAPRTVKLAPTVNDRGFHYGAYVPLPARLTKVVVAIGRPQPPLRMTPTEAARFGKGAEVSFDWTN
jgi:hypothetical protein